jgi:hypothetical protein
VPIGGAPAGLSLTVRYSGSVSAPGASRRAWVSSSLPWGEDSASGAARKEVDVAVLDLGVQGLLIE